MATTTTDAETIRDNIADLIEAITPTKLESVRFERSLEEVVFEPWAEQNAASALRRFSILEVGTRELPLVSGLGVEDDLATFEILIAYPRSYSLYGRGNARDAHDVMNADANLLKGRNGISIQNPGGYVSGQDSSAIVEQEPQDGDRVIFLRLLVEAQFKRSVS